MSTSRRDLLHRNHVAAFCQWASAKGWISEPVKSGFEVMRLRSVKTVHVFYERANDRAKAHQIEIEWSTHITVPRGAIHLVREFIASRPTPERL